LKLIIFATSFLLSDQGCKAVKIQASQPKTNNKYYT
jgi:hypothetical protein